MKARSHSVQSGGGHSPWTQISLQGYTK